MKLCTVAATASYGDRTCEKFDVFTPQIVASAAGSNIFAVIDVFIFLLEVGRIFQFSK